MEIPTHVALLRHTDNAERRITTNALRTAEISLVNQVIKLANNHSYIQFKILKTQM
jgi:hypothetical protein